MKFILPVCLLFSFFSAFSQQTPYQPFEVDSIAEPRGGMVFFNTFLQANLRKPISAEARGIGGRVIVSGVVEPNGTISNVSVINKISPDCDREATRVFTLFNAWKPAHKDGKAVRQRVSMPIMFKANEPFVYSNGARIIYFDENEKLADSLRALYKQVIPIDSTGTPAGDIVLYKRKGKNWQEDSRLPLIRKQNIGRSSDGKPIHAIGYRTSAMQWEGHLVHIDDAGQRIFETYYQKGQRTGPSVSYHLNGVVDEKVEDGRETIIITSWYPNGQIKQISSDIKKKPLEPSLAIKQVTGFWDSTGHQLVKDGNGSVQFQSQEESYADTTQQTIFTEQGRFENGLKQGLWTGRYADGSYFYEETYAKGICQGGKARQGNADTVRYTIVEQQPEFPGGLQGLGQFLSQNLQYPVMAQRAGAQGKVFVSFVVCTDGTLCDYEVLKGVHPDLDKEAVRVVKKMSGKWKPGIQRGQNVRVKYNLPINFSLY